MTEQVFLWIMGALIAAICAVIKKLFGDMKDITDSAKSLNERFSLLENQNEKRITRIETLIEIMGLSAAKILHSPHDPFGLDKYLDIYLQRHFEMTTAQWEEVLSKCKMIVNDKTKSDGHRFSAAWLAGVAHHKLMHDPQEAQKLLDSLREQS